MQLGKHCCCHCGLPAPHPCFHEENGEQHAFCCRTCRQVYLLMQELESSGL